MTLEASTSGHKKVALLCQSSKNLYPNHGSAGGMPDVEKQTLSHVFVDKEKQETEKIMNCISNTRGY